MRTENYTAKYFSATVGDAKAAASWKGWKFITFCFEVNPVVTTRQISSPFVEIVTGEFMVRRMKQTVPWSAA